MVSTSTSPQQSNSDPPKHLYDEKPRQSDARAENEASVRSSYVGASSEEKDIDRGALGQQSHAGMATNGDVEQQQLSPGPENKAAHHVNDLSSVPNGGLRSWLQVAGGFVLFFNSWGIINTFGVYETFYVLDILKENSPSTIAWIGSIQAFLLLVVGMLSGPVYDMGYFRHLLLTGSFLIVFGHMMLSLSTTFWQVLLSQAFCIGIGMGCLFIPSVAILATYFTSKLAFAMGIAASGSSLGGVLYPIILYRLLPRIGFPWAVRTIGFIALATLLVPNLVMKVRVLPAERRKMIDITAFKELPFMTFCVGCFVCFLGLYMPFFYMQSYAITDKITTENFAFYLLSILNATSIFGRIVPNFIADRTGPMNMIVPCALMSGVLIFCLIAVHNLGGIVVFALMFGFFSGSLVSLPPTVIVHLTKDRRFIGTRLGMSFAFVALGTLVGTPVGGVIIRKAGYDKAWIFGGVLATAGGVVIGLARVAHKGWNPATKA